jgi:hypothetical protein
MSSRIVRRLASWVALVAILAVTFMPTVTQAVSGSVALASVCSADSSRQPAPGDGRGQHVLDHCPYCALHADLATPPLPEMSAVGSPVRFSELPPAFFRAPRATAIWSASQQRGPPVLA